MCLVSGASDPGRDGQAFKMTCHCQREVVKNIVLLSKKLVHAKVYKSSCMQKTGGKTMSIKLLNETVSFIFNIE